MSVSYGELWSFMTGAAPEGEQDGDKKGTHASYLLRRSHHRCPLKSPYSGVAGLLPQSHNMWLLLGLLQGHR